MRDSWVPRIRVLGRAVTLSDYLRQAADSGDLAWAKKLIVQGAPADGDAESSSPPSSSSPLFLAARGGHRDLVALLLSHGADPARCGPEGTPLMAACAANSAECVQALLSAAAAETPARLSLATARHPTTGETALHVAARSGAADAARALLDGVSSSGSDGAATAASQLCWSRDARGRTPAVAAGAAPCGAASIEVMALLLASAAAASAGGVGGALPHHHHQTSSGPLLPPSSSPLSPADSYASSSPPSPAATTTTTTAAAAASPAGADTTALHLAAARGNGPLCSALLAACGSRAALRHDARGALPLHLAARCARYDCAAILCRAMGFKGVKAARDVRTGATPLHEAAKSLLAPDAEKKAAMAELLIEGGCDPTARDGGGRLACDYDCAVMPPVEMEKQAGGSAAIMAATAKVALELAVELAREGAERAAAGAEADVAEREEDEASARASVVLAADPSTAATAKTIAAKEQEAVVDEDGGGWTIERGGEARVVEAAALPPQTDSASA